MATTAPVPGGFARIFAWPRVRFTLAFSIALGALMGIASPTPFFIVIIRTVLTALGVLLVFGWLETWPRKLPRWMPRTVWRLLGIAAVLPIASGIACALTGGHATTYANGKEHAVGTGMLVFTGLLFAPWIAVGAIIRERDSKVREQAFAFELERSEYERRMSDARLRQLQAQVEPHFLFNTLANVQALVDSGSPQASKVLTSLIAYLRAAVPRMQSQSGTVGDEVDLVRAYLEIMQMRMPDRLRYAIHLEPAAARLQCPPLALLTLVENSVRHGIDPSETGGRIEVDVWRRDSRCIVRVTDTGAGLQRASRGLGTGLATLRERLRLAFGGDARLELTEVVPHGVCAQIDVPARENAA